MNSSDSDPSIQSTVSSRFAVHKIDNDSSEKEETANVAPEQPAEVAEENVNEQDNVDKHEKESSHSTVGSNVGDMNRSSEHRTDNSSGYGSALSSKLGSWRSTQLSELPDILIQRPDLIFQITINPVANKQFENSVPDDYVTAVFNALANEDLAPPEEKTSKSVEVGRVPEIELPNPLEKIDCITWFSPFTYGHLLRNINPTGAEYPIKQYIENLERLGRWPLWLKKKMPLLFGKSHKSPAEVVKSLREVLILIDKGAVHDKKLEKALEEISKNVASIKAFIYGNDSTEPNNDHVIQVAQLAQEVYNANILPMLVKLLPRFDFECKKDVGQIFNNLLRRQIGTRSPTVEYLGARPEILLQLVQGYSQPDIALTCGSMLRESIRHDHLAKIILYSDIFYTFFKYVQSEVFDIASDAFSTFKDLMTRHKSIVAEFLDPNYDIFFGKEQYQSLLNSKNYVTRRQSLKLLGELLLDRHNFGIMNKYISNPENLRLMMELLRDKSRNIQYEAFHVFKVFVANPNKPKPISDILLRNRDKLVEFLGEFHNDRTDDEQFNDEKAYLVKQIQEMKAPPKEPKKPRTETQPGSSEASPSPDQQQ